MFWVISQPNIDGFCFNMDDLNATMYRIVEVNTNTIQNKNRRFVWLAAILGDDTS